MRGRPPPAPRGARSPRPSRAARRGLAQAALPAGGGTPPRRPPRRKRRSASARASPAFPGRERRWRRRAAPTRRRGSPRASCAAPLAEAAQLEQVSLHVIAGGAPDLGERALQRLGMELAGAAAGGADDGVMAARGPLALPAGADRAGAEDAVEEAQLEQRAEVAVDGDAVHAHALALEGLLQLARPERAG